MSVSMLSCGQFPEELAYKYLAHDVQSNAALQSFEDPILYKPIDPTSDTIIWLPLEDGGKKNANFLLFEGKFWRPYKAYTIIRILSQAYNQNPRRILEGGWYFKDPMTRRLIDASTELLLSSPFEQGVSKVKIHHKDYSERSLRTQFLIGDFSADGTTDKHAISFLSDSDVFTDAKFSFYRPVGLARSYLLEHPDYFKEGQFLESGKFHTEKWQFPNGSWFSFIYDSQKKKTGFIRMHTAQGVNEVIRYCDFPKYIPLGNL